MRKYWLFSGLVILVVGTFAPAWWVKGHGTIAEAAASRLPETVPAFFRAGGKHLGHLAGDPDRWKYKETKHLLAAEYSNHFIDLEDYNGKDLPEDRYKAIALLVELKRQPEKVGMLPYAIMEGYDRLTSAFADYRVDPKNEAVRMKCLVYAGNLAHYTGDAVMPLHTTRDYDGRKGADGTVMQKGIHVKIDAFPEKNSLTPEEIARDLEPQAIDDMWAYVRKRIQESHALVSRCYELDAAGTFDKPTAESRTFILERCRAGAQFTMDLWYNAWLKSEQIKPPY
jgi:hypothetical protein